MHEVLLSDDEHGVRHAHPMITHVKVPPMSPAELEDAPGTAFWHSTPEYTFEAT